MRVVIDTNVLFSGFYETSSPPGQILRAAALGRIHLCAPNSVKSELTRALRRKMSYSESDIESAIDGLPVEWIDEALYRRFVAEAMGALRDPSDVPVLACALAIGCDMVSGDKDLHAVKLKGIRVWTPADLVA